MSFDFHVLIPARFQSSRLPGKLLMELQGLTILERVYRQVQKANPKSITIATDSDEIANIAKGFGAEVEMTAPTHQSGTDRITEVVAKKKFASSDIIVNVQGDEPLIEPILIQQVAQILHMSKEPVATLCWPIETEAQFLNPNVVKVVKDKYNNALYFSRSPIPMHRDKKELADEVYRHIGLYAYRAGFLLEFVQWEEATLEKLEALEQLRILAEGHKIKVAEALVKPLQDINTIDDLNLARELLEKTSS